jgi:Mg2+ and Co2+ transporter CorA
MNKTRIISVIVIILTIVAWVVNYFGANFTIEPTADFQPGTVYWFLYIPIILLAVYKFIKAKAK